MRGPTYPPESTPGTPPSNPGPIAGAPAQVREFGGSGDRGAGVWPSLAIAGKSGGLLLIFAGTLVAIVFGSYPAYCFNSTCTTSTSAWLQYGIEASRLLWAIGAFGLGAGAGIRLHFMLREPPTETPEANDRLLDERHRNAILFLAAVVILLLLTMTGGIMVAPRL